MWPGPSPGFSRLIKVPRIFFVRPLATKKISGMGRFFSGMGRFPGFSTFNIFCRFSSNLKLRPDPKTSFHALYQCHNDILMILFPSQNWPRPEIRPIFLFSGMDVFFQPLIFWPVWIFFKVKTWSKHVVSRAFSSSQWHFDAPTPRYPGGHAGP